MTSKPNNKLDSRQAAAVMAMYSQKEAARRLRCSTRHLRRISQPLHTSNAHQDMPVTAAPSSCGLSPLQPTREEELFLMHYYRRLGDSYATISHRFGLSAQAVDQRLREELL